MPENTPPSTKNITVLMPGRPASRQAGGNGGGDPLFITTEREDTGDTLEPMVRKRLSILKYKEIEYLVNERISRDFKVRVKGLRGEGVSYRLSTDVLESGHLDDKDLDQIRNSDVIIAYIGNQKYYSDTVDIIYELALRNVLRSELILLGELKGADELVGRVGGYLSSYISRNVPFSEHAETFRCVLEIARGRDHPLEGYNVDIPDSLKIKLDRGHSSDLEEALRSGIAEAITNPPEPHPFLKYFKLLDPQHLVSTSITYMPSSVVKVTFGPQSPGQDWYTEDQLREIVVCDYDSDFTNLYAFRDGNLTGPIDGDFLQHRMKKFVDEADLKAFNDDQAKLFESIVYRPGVGAASVPLRINGNHPLPAYRNQEFLPFTILRRRIGDPSREHSYLLLVVYSDVARWRQRVQEFEPKPKRLRTVPTYFDEKVVQLTFRQQVLPREYGGRVLYLGDEGAQAWLNLCRDDSYTLAGDRAYRLRELRRGALEKVDVQTETIVSLGPGDGEADADLVDRLGAVLTKVRYIPVEISTGLLAIVLQRLQESVDVPIALLVDFEAGLRQVEKALDDHARPKPVLFSLVGGTFGNLERAGATFLEKLRSVMQPGDGLLLDVPLAGPAWTAEKDPRMDPKSFPTSFRRFLASGLARLDDEPGPMDYMATFEDRVGCECRASDEIEDTHMITIRDRDTRRALLRLHRYRWETFIPWLEGLGYAVRYQRNTLSSSNDPSGMGAVLLERRP